MSNLYYLFTKSKLLLIFLGIGFLLLVLAPFYLPTNEKPAASPRPSATVSRGLPNFPTAQPQEFAETTAPSGSLFITSNTDPVRVTIDSEKAQSLEFFSPENYTPFILEKIPEGKHTLRVSKLGFLNQVLIIEIKANQPNQALIQMQADPDFDALKEATKQMPISTDEYTINYLDAIGKIHAIINKAPFETYKQRAIEWFKQRGVSNPEESGVLFYPALNINR